MNPPKLIYVGPYDVQMRVLQKLDVLGEADPDNGEITLFARQSKSQMRSTVLHELLHVIAFQSGLRKSMSLTTESEEQLILTIEPWILQTLQENPALVEFLTTTERATE